MSDTGETYWLSTFEIAERYGISAEAARKNIRRHRLGVQLAEGRGRPAWLASAPLYRAWDRGDTGVIFDEERESMAILAQRLSVP